jgi:hypothetical protein
LNEKLFVEKWIGKIQSAGIKHFPNYFLDDTQLEIISIPIKTLVMGQEFFGSFEIITTDGSSVYQAANYDEAKFFLYSSRERNGKAYLPKDKSLIKATVNSYNKYLDDLIEQIKKDYKSNFSDGKNLLAVSNEIFQKLNLIRY